jgi:hypothetical protein
MKMIEDMIPQEREAKGGITFFINYFQLPMFVLGGE